MGLIHWIAYMTLDVWMAEAAAEEVGRLLSAWIPGPGARRLNLSTASRRWLVSAALPAATLLLVHAAQI